MSFCLEDVNTVPNGVTIKCPIANSPFPSPQFTMTTSRIFVNRSAQELLSNPSHRTLLNDSKLLLLFEEETNFINITCAVFNDFGIDRATTMIRICGMCYKTTPLATNEYCMFQSTDPTECQLFATNDCQQICTRSTSESNATTTYECDCNEGYSLFDGTSCIGMKVAMRILYHSIKSELMIMFVLHNAIYRLIVNRLLPADCLENSLTVI